MKTKKELDVQNPLAEAFGRRYVVDMHINDHTNVCSCSKMN